MTKEISNIINAIKYEIDAMCKTNDMYELTCLRADIIDNINKLAHKKRECIEAADDSAPGSWIPVSERLPKASEYVGNVAKYYLVQNEYGDMLVARYTHSDYWEQIYRMQPIADEIVAWRELPEPYKAESEDTDADSD